MLQQQRGSIYIYNFLSFSLGCKNNRIYFTILQFVITKGDVLENNEFFEIFGKISKKEREFF
jgi:hypothetical protein